MTTTTAELSAGTTLPVVQSPLTRQLIADERRTNSEPHAGRLKTAAALPRTIVSLAAAVATMLWLLVRSRWRRVVKDLVERAFALGVLLAALPLMLVIAALVKVTSPGPVLFRQRRVSSYGESFGILKFRTMRVDAESMLEQLRPHNEVDGGTLFKIREDPRVTRVGRLLRRWSLDELPQLINVVRGDMALIGPRPSLPEEAAGYSDAVRRRLHVKPGMTGLWQVSGRSDLSWEDGIRLDLYYVENWSLWLDVKIFCRTPIAVLKTAGAY